MAKDHPGDDQLKRLRSWRNYPERDPSMHFLAKLFKQKVEKPHKQLAGIVEAWETLLPAELLSHTRLESFQRGVLKINVDSTAWLYELDRQLRSGLEQQLKQAKAGHAVRRIQLTVAAFNPDDTHN